MMHHEITMLQFVKGVSIKGILTQKSTMAKAIERPINFW